MLVADRVGGEYALFTKLCRVRNQGPASLPKLIVKGPSEASYLLCESGTEAGPLGAAHIACPAVLKQGEHGAQHRDQDQQRQLNAALTKVLHGVRCFDDSGTKLR